MLILNIPYPVGQIVSFEFQGRALHLCIAPSLLFDIFLLYLSQASSNLVKLCTFILKAFV